jgi:coenzyme F420-0:L-glutamate ligase / coenzyme F420-1:gamma-L-glutamate ligase
MRYRLASAVDLEERDIVSELDVPAGSHELPTAEIRIIGLRHIPEVKPHDDLAGLIIEATLASGITLEAADVVVVTHKVVSKAENALVDLRTVEPSDLARRFGEAWNKDPRYIEIVLRESDRVLRMERGLIISRTHHGLTCANAAVDASNVSGGEIVALLPRDPDASAAALREEFNRRLGLDVAVIISDSFGRPWRTGITNVAIGVAGMFPLADYRGQPDDFGRTMSASVLAVADEIAGAAELVSGKINRCPVMVVRGYDYPKGNGRAADLIMADGADLFR